jgi:hypothetical protein
MALNIARKFSREKIISYFAREFAVEIAVTGLPMLLGIKLQTSESKQDAFVIAPQKTFLYRQDVLADRGNLGPGTVFEVTWFSGCSRGSAEHER